jgi:hypothetical protein
MLILNLQEYQPPSLPLSQVKETYITPLDFFNALTLDTFYQGSQHDPLMQTAVLKVSCCRAALHDRHDLLDMVGSCGGLAGANMFHHSSKKLL